MKEISIADLKAGETYFVEWKKSTPTPFYYNAGVKFVGTFAYTLTTDANVAPILVHFKNVCNLNQKKNENNEKNIILQMIFADLVENNDFSTVRGWRFYTMESTAICLKHILMKHLQIDIVPDMLYL